MIKPPALRPFILMLAALLAPPAAASDSTAVLRGLQQIQGIIEKSERDAARAREARERQEAAEMQRLQAQQAQEAKQKQAREAEARHTRDAELAALTPPAPWGGNLVFHRRLLESAPNEQQASLRIAGTDSATIAADGSHLVYLAEDRRLILRELPSGRERVLRSNLDRSGWYSPNLPADAGTLLLSGSNGAELMDLQGGRLQQWLEADVSAWAYKHSVIVTKQQFYPERFCRWVGQYDVRTGQATSRLTLDPPAESCVSRINAAGRLEVLAIDGDTVRHYVDGQQVQRFRGDSRRGSSDTHLIYGFVGELPYVVSYLHANQPTTEPFRVWDLATGRLLCELPRSNHGGLSASPEGDAFITSPPALVSLPSCERRPLANSGMLNVEGGFAFQYQPGEVLVRTLPDLAVKHRLAVSFTDQRGGGVALRRLPGQPRYLAVGPWVWNAQEGESTEFFDLEDGQRLLTQPGGLALTGPYTHLGKRGFRSGEETSSQFWKVNLGQPRVDTTQTFLAALKKDKYETAAEYRARTRALSAPFEMDIQVKDYDAEAGHFVGEWRGVPIGIPLAASQARRLDGISPLTVKGQLAPVDEDFIELRDARILLPDGSSQPVARKPLAPRAATPAAAAPSPAPKAAASATASAKTQAGSNCSGTLAHLAPKLRAYSDPLLAEVRQAILSAPVHREAAAGARQQAALAEASAADAARSAQQTDGGGNSIARADAGTLPLNWPCEGIHASAVCMYIAHGWEALAYRELAANKACAPG